jgi:hypothetical protein
MSRLANRHNQRPTAAHTRLDTGAAAQLGRAPVSSLSPPVLRHLGLLRSPYLACEMIPAVALSLSAFYVCFEASPKAGWRAHSTVVLALQPILSSLGQSLCSIISDV